MSEQVAALTQAQRFHFDAYGYVLLKGALTPDEVERMREALYRLRAEADPAAHRVYVNSRNDHHWHVGHLVEYDPALLEYAAHPHLVPLVESVVGGRVLLEESEAIINRRDPNVVFTPGQQVVPTGFHTGTEHGWGTYFRHERFHCLFVKTLAYLTEVGPDDGGTAVIPGSHKMAWPQAEMVRAANEDPTLIHQVTANAGDVLLFAESLIHSTTAIRGDRERVILVSGYSPTNMRVWPGNEISPEFVASLPEALRPLIGGTESWPWRRV